MLHNYMHINWSTEMIISVSSLGIMAKLIGITGDPWTFSLLNIDKMLFSYRTDHVCNKLMLEHKYVITFNNYRMSTSLYDLLNALFGISLEIDRIYFLK